MAAGSVIRRRQSLIDVPMMMKNADHTVWNSARVTADGERFRYSFVRQGRAAVRHHRWCRFRWHYRSACAGRL
jgi:hypothetical protein